MNERDSVRVKHEQPRGILNVPAAQASEGLSRYWPSGDLAPFVEHYWSVRWDLREPRVAETIPHPSVHVVLESSGSADVVGVMRTRFSRRLEGHGRVLGIKFHPGGFRAFVRHPVSAFTDRRPSLRTVFGRRAAGLAARVLEHEDDVAAAHVAEGFLRGLAPVANDELRLARRVAERIAQDRELTRVQQLVDEFRIGLRRLQRLFSEYVGVSPKWVIQRYRLLDGAERVAAGTVVDWADLALQLGYADQAHFIRDFKRLVGRTPAEYARQLARGTKST